MIPRRVASLLPRWLIESLAPIGRGNDMEAVVNEPFISRCWSRILQD